VARGWLAHAGSGTAVRARADDPRLATLHVDGAFLGVRVPPGVDRLTLTYRPHGFALGVAIGVAAWAIVAVLLAADRRALARFVSAPARARWPRPRLAVLGAAAVAFYLLASLAQETMTALHPYWLRGPYSFRERNPARWRLASAPVARLRAFLEEVEPFIPAGSRVAFAGRDFAGTENAYRAMWVTYLLPRHHVLPAGQWWDGDYYLAYGIRLDRPDLELIWESEDGAVYRWLRQPVGGAGDGVSTSTPVLSSSQ
jgi:hypothetical protein